MSLLYGLKYDDGPLKIIIANLTFLKKSFISSLRTLKKLDT